MNSCAQKLILSKKSTLSAQYEYRESSLAYSGIPNRKYRVLVLQFTDNVSLLCSANTSCRSQHKLYLRKHFMLQQSTIKSCLAIFQCFYHLDDCSLCLIVYCIMMVTFCGCTQTHGRSHSRVAVTIRRDLKDKAAGLELEPLEFGHSSIPYDVYPRCIKKLYYFH